MGITLLKVNHITDTSGRSVQTHIRITIQAFKKLYNQVNLLNLSSQITTDLITKPTKI